MVKVCVDRWRDIFQTRYVMGNKCYSFNCHRSSHVGRNAASSPYSNNNASMDDQSLAAAKPEFGREKLLFFYEK